MSKKAWIAIAITSAVIVLILLAVIFLGLIHRHRQNQLVDEATTTEQVDEQTGEQTATGDAADEIVAATCADLGDTWDTFAASEPTMTFCYLSSWGQPGFVMTTSTEQGREGEIYYIDFANTQGNYPIISLSTLDYRNLGDSDIGPGISWRLIDFNKSETELEYLFVRSEDPNVEKMQIAGIDVMKVERNFDDPITGGRTTSIDYFIPDVMIDGEAYNVYVTCFPSQESAVEILLQTLLD